MVSGKTLGSPGPLSQAECLFLRIAGGQDINVIASFLSWFLFSKFSSSLTRVSYKRFPQDHLLQECPTRV